MNDVIVYFVVAVAMIAAIQFVEISGKVE